MAETSARAVDAPLELAREIAVLAEFARAAGVLALEVSAATTAYPDQLRVGLMLIADGISPASIERILGRYAETDRVLQHRLFQLVAAGCRAIEARDNPRVVYDELSGLLWPWERLSPLEVDAGSAQPLGEVDAPAAATALLVGFVHLSDIASRDGLVPAFDALAVLLERVFRDHKRLALIPAIRALVQTYHDAQAQYGDENWSVAPTFHDAVINAMRVDEERAVNAARVLAAGLLAVQAGSGADGVFAAVNQYLGPEEREAFDADELRVRGREAATRYRPSEGGGT
jgi:flagellar motor component MotA